MVIYSGFYISRKLYKSDDSQRENKKNQIIQNDSKYDTESIFVPVGLKSFIINNEQKQQDLFILIEYLKAEKLPEGY